MGGRKKLVCTCASPCLLAAACRCTSGCVLKVGIDKNRTSFLQFLCQKSILGFYRFNSVATEAHTKGSIRLACQSDHPEARFAGSPGWL